MGVYEKMTALADAIRSKTGGTDKLSIDGMTEAVNGISAGGGELDSLIDGSITEVTSNAESVKTYKFFNCTKLITVNLPKVLIIENNGFANCILLKSVKTTLLKTINSYVFSQCGRLEYVDCGLCTAIKNSAFEGCKNLKTLILRSDTLCTLASSFYYDSPIAKGNGYIYVPRTLVEEYKVATNWTTYASQFRALEDYTVDGTITGELDEIKIAA